MLVAVIALVAALAGTATALPGKNSVAGGDLKRGAVGKRALRHAAVTTKAIKEGSVDSPQLADGAVTPAKLAATEAPHVVGAPGEPQFANGGEGDCVWANVGPDQGFTGADPVSYYKDGFGTVHLAGIAFAVDGPDGDGSCDPTAPGEEADGIVFTLPPGYQPTGAKLYNTLDLVAIAPIGGATISGTPHPAGAVASESTTASLDGLTFRAATTASPAARARIDLDAARRLGR
jgi:hypothetical protein